MMTISNGNLRVDLRLIADMVEPGSRVLDVGCGEGALLDWLGRTKNVDGRGIELSMAGVSAAVSHGLSVIQGDADTDLKDYPSGAFDYVILSQTLQATYAPRTVLSNMLRIGRRAIVSFPNFGHWRVRLHLLTHGRMPVTDTLAYEWYDTPNIHFCTIRDFLDLCRDLGIRVERSIPLDRSGRTMAIPSCEGIANLFADQGLFVLSREG
ncbi:Homoserine O-acetyltransferase [Paramagnetospirillum magnetotacticum MS-1]|uniref:Homoserine O-acetyltransferase n=1 Tax=Paramagnetospirillum magnetotacticum MS-1 TaxID=272627 RepID=A0A0C2YIZ7_PARME|nr:methionine biosynthesis protein MetW [Paramagnetospirillum magnetotacticum]KIL99724.1 Homoserine O-acetyltransferase [Paramagnetospirillum magnetotacticum MS-1]